MPRARSDAFVRSLWGQASLSRGTSFGWIHGDRHEACHPHTSRFFPVLVLKLRRLNYEHASFFFIRSYLLCLIRPALGGSAPDSHGAEVVIYPRGWIPPFGSRMPPDDLSRSERRARLDEWPAACESVRGPSPTSRLPILGRMLWGPGALGPGLFLTHLLWANRTQHHSSWTSQGLSRSQERPPEPCIRAKPRQPSIALQRTSPAGALPPSKLRTEQWADRPRPGQRGTYALAFFPSTPWTDAYELIPACRQEIGYFSLRLTLFPICPPH
jgi:hypothetical protein